MITNLVLWPVIFNIIVTSNKVFEIEPISYLSIVRLLIVDFPVDIQKFCIILVKCTNIQLSCPICCWILFFIRVRYSLKILERFCLGGRRSYFCWNPLEVRLRLTIISQLKRTQLYCNNLREVLYVFCRRMMVKISHKG